MPSHTTSTTQGLPQAKVSHRLIATAIRVYATADEAEITIAYADGHERVTSYRMFRGCLHSMRDHGAYEPLLTGGCYGSPIRLTTRREMLQYVLQDPMPASSPHLVTILDDAGMELVDETATYRRQQAYRLRGAEYRYPEPEPTSGRER